VDEANETGRTLGARVFNWFVIALFSGQVLYSIYQVFVVLAVEGHTGPLGAVAAAMPPEQLLARRLYAVEGWLAGGALLIYVAITEPGLRRR